MKLPKFKDYKDQPVKYIQVKRNGHMYYVTRGQSGIIFCTTKNGKDKTNKMMAINHIWEELKGLPYRTELMAELHCPGEFATSVPTMLNNADERLQLSVFACPTLGGHDLMDEPLDEVMAKVKSMGLGVVPMYQYWGSTTTFTATEREQLLGQATIQKIEGWVLKESHMEGWYKLKPVKTIDAFITDHQMSDSATYKGCLKSVSLGLFETNGVDIHDLGECGGGFTKEFKLSLNTVQLRNNLIDKVIEVAYQSVTPGKKLQFPRFVRFRDDKDASQCTVGQLDG